MATNYTVVDTGDSYGVKLKKFKNSEDETAYWNNFLENTDSHKLVDDIRTLTPIQEFYSGSIFITGASGFLGICLLEKLLRTCPKLNKIFILIRTKKSISQEDRLNKLFEESIFKKTLTRNPILKRKVIIIPGEMNAPNLGISDENRRMLTNEVNFIIHSAATVRYNERLDLALQTNLHGAEAMLKLGADCKDLRSYVHISTAYANCTKTRSGLGEEFYKTHIHYTEILKLIDSFGNKEKLWEVQNKLVGPHLNSYTFSKALSESMMSEKVSNFPLSIFRPAIVVPTYQEPIKCWANNTQALTGIIASMACGYQRVLHVDTEIPAEIIPVDVCVNGIIAAGYETGIEYKKNPTEYKTKVYNSASWNGNKRNWDVVFNTIKHYVWQYPASKMLWYPILFLEESSFDIASLSFFFQYLPYLMMQGFFYFGIMDQDLSKMHGIVKNTIKETAVFVTRKWDIDTNNLEQLWEKLTEDDKKLFFFNMRAVDWEQWFEGFFFGVRKYVIKDDFRTLPKARKQLKRLYILHQSILVLIGCLVLYTLWFLYSLF